MADGTRGKRWIRRDTILRVAIAIKEDDDGGVEAFVFHGPTGGMVKRVFDQLCGTMMQDYSYCKVRLPDMVNGCCPAHWEVKVVKPDFHLAAPAEWCNLIARLMSRCHPCIVKICKNYEQFLNL